MRVWAARQILQEWGCCRNAMPQWSKSMFLFLEVGASHGIGDIWSKAGSCRGMGASGERLEAGEEEMA